jgi:hypothetical protein
MVTRAKAKQVRRVSAQSHIEHMNKRLESMLATLREVSSELRAMKRRSEDSRELMKNDDNRRRVALEVLALMQPQAFEEVLAKMKTYDAQDTRSN